MKLKENATSRYKLTGEAFKWSGIFEDQLGRECNHITCISEEERKHDLSYLWPY